MKILKLKPPKEVLLSTYEACKRSLSKTAKQLNVGRQLVTKWLAEENIKSEYFKTTLKREDLEAAILQDLSPIEIANQHNCAIEVVTQRLKYYGLVLAPAKILSLSETVAICKQISNESWDNQGFTKKLIYGRPSLYWSILQHTSTIPLTTKKLTERVFRLLGGDLLLCKKCEVPLKFYTMVLGYGNNLNKERIYCRNCFTSSVFFAGASKISQELFWELYRNLSEEAQKYVRFRDLNGEKRIEVTSNHTGNKRCYLLDFCLHNKNIELDGIFWHKNRKEKDEIRDKFLQEHGYSVLRLTDEQWYSNPEAVIQECLTFLNN